MRSRSPVGYQQNLLGDEVPLGVLPSRELLSGYQTRAGFVVNTNLVMDLEEYGAEFKEGRWGDQEISFANMTQDQKLELAGDIFQL